MLISNKIHYFRNFLLQNYKNRLVSQIILTNIVVYRIKILSFVACEQHSFQKLLFYLRCNIQQVNLFCSNGPFQDYLLQFFY